MVFWSEDKPVDLDPAPALTRGLELLQLLEEKGPSSLEHLTNETGWPKSSVSRLLTSLSYSGVVERHPTSKRFSATFRLVPITPGESDLRKVCSEELYHLAKASEMTAELHVFDGEYIVLADRCEPPEALSSARLQIGSTRDLSEFEATVQIVIAYALEKDKWPKASLRICQDGAESFITPDQISDVIRDVRGCRVAMDFGFNPYGVRRIASPLFSAGESFVGIVALAQVQTPRANELGPQLADMVHDSALRMSNLLDEASLDTTCPT